MLKKYLLPILSLGILTAIIGFINYAPGTILTGGDNLHPEFNFWLNIKRSLFAAWQEYQGPGLLGGMGHAADLVRQLILWLMSTVIPNDQLRYIWTLLTLFIGSTGAYVLIRSVLGRISKITQLKTLYAFIGSSAYLLNLSTLQTYYTPFETFTSHFAALPWLFWSLQKYVLKPTPKNLLLFSIILILASPQNYVPTIFVVTTAAVSVLLPFLLHQKFGFKHKPQYIVRSLKVLGLIIAINAFWLLPFLLFSLTKSSVNVDSRINQMATETIYLQNKEFGHITDVMLLKGFWFNNVDAALQGFTNYMLAPWREYVEQLHIIIIGYAIFLLGFLGIIVGIRNKDRVLMGYGAVFLFSVAMLTTATPPFSWLNDGLRQLPLFGQIFRFPFTKFSILASLVYSLFFAAGLLWIHLQIKHKLKKVSYGLIPLAFIALVIFMLPVFQGNLFYVKEQVTLPTEYKNVMEFFSKQDPATRIANFPQHTFWSWNFYNFGYTGSGFLWYGVEQPIMDRAFDPWSQESENYYHEVSQAVYSKNIDHLKSVLNKYQIRWLLIDRNIINPVAPKSLFADEITAMISDDPSFTKEFQEGGLEVYRVTSEYPSEAFVSAYTSLPAINGYTWGNTDHAYMNSGPYITADSNTKSQFYYPFRSFPTNRNEGFDHTISRSSGSITMSSSSQDIRSDTALAIPSLAETETLIPARIYTAEKTNGDKTLYVSLQTPEIYLDDEQIYGTGIDIELMDLPKDSTAAATLRINDNQVIDIHSRSFTSRTTMLSINQTNYVVFLQDGKPVNTIEIDVLSEIDRSLIGTQRIPVTPGEERNLRIEYPLVNDSYMNYEINPSSLKTEDCNIFRNGTGTTSVNAIQKSITFLNVNDTLCSATYTPHLLHDNAYAIFLESSNQAGRGLHFWVLNQDQSYAPLDVYTPQVKDTEQNIYLLPPQAKHGKAYSFHFDNISIGNMEVKNTLHSFGVYPIPYRFLSNIRWENSASAQSAIKTKPQVSHPHPALYVISYPSGLNEDNILSLAQAYDSGWHAYTFDRAPSFIQQYLPIFGGNRLHDHLKLNNWQNGWTVEETGTRNIVITYFPQYLQYIGFLTLVITLIIVARASKSSR